MKTLPTQTLRISSKTLWLKLLLKLKTNANPVSKYLKVTYPDKSLNGELSQFERRNECNRRMRETDELAVNSQAMLQYDEFTEQSDSLAMKH